MGDGVRSLPDWVEGVGDCPGLLGSLLWKRPDWSLGLEDMLDQYQREVLEFQDNINEEIIIPYLYMFPFRYSSHGHSSSINFSLSPILPSSKGPNLRTSLARISRT